MGGRFESGFAEKCDFLGTCAIKKWLLKRLRSFFYQGIDFQIEPGGEVSEIDQSDPPLPLILLLLIFCTTESNFGSAESDAGQALEHLEVLGAIPEG